MRGATVAMLALVAVTLACGPGRLVRRGVLNEDLLHAVEDELATVRRLAFRRAVPAQVLPPAAMEQSLSRELDLSFPRDDLAEVEAVYARLGLLPDGTHLRPALETLYEGQVAAFYDPRTRALTVASDAVEPGGAGMRLLTALTGRDLVGELLVSHELTHALQDQYWGLPTEPEPITDADGDRELARRALLEGDAVLASFATVARREPDADTRAQIDRELGGLPTMLAESYRDVPEILRAPLAFQYREGTAFAIQAYQRGGWPAIDAAQANPPVSSEQVLHPERYFETRDAPSGVVLAGSGPLEQKGFRLVLSDTLGELGVRIVVGRTLPAADAARVASGWDGDTLKAWRRGDELAAAWLSVWDTPEDAAELATALTTALPAARVETRGALVLLTSGPFSDAQVRIFWEAARIVARPAARVTSPARTRESSPGSGTGSGDAGAGEGCRPLSRP